MNKLERILLWTLAVAFLLSVPVLHGAPPNPWDGSYEGDPQNSDAISGGALEIRDLKTAIRDRLDLEMDFGSAIGPSDTGRMREGSARAFAQAAEPANLASNDIDGSNALDDGRLMVDTDAANVLKYYNEGGASWDIAAGSASQRWDWSGAAWNVIPDTLRSGTIPTPASGTAYQGGLIPYVVATSANPSTVIPNAGAWSAAACQVELDFTGRGSSTTVILLASAQLNTDAGLSGDEPYETALYIDGVLEANSRYGSLVQDKSSAVGGGNIAYVASAAAGSRTYDIRARVSDGSATGVQEIEYCSMVAIDLGLQ